ncbi:MAG: LysM peptidoglycan-binding domain-containing protein [Sphingobacteriaceae bacterium]|nr:LysM peptidoglycan-binding domain-containing protein [Cytophagaceae bacterium]
MQRKVLLLLLLPLSTLAQNAYRVPRSLDFAGLNVRFDEGARQVIQTDVNALMSNRKVLDARLDRVAQYFPMIEAIFAEEEVPTDFKYLVVQESGLVPDAVSTSNAVGFWQFKKETAGDFGLRVDGEVDERKNIHASTRAAGRYLKRNNATLNNWISTLYSYYLGLGGVQKLIPDDWMGANSISVTGQTDRYILRCMAHKIVYEQELQVYKPAPVGFYEYRYGNGKTFAQIAAELQVDEAELRRHNRWVGGSTIPPDKEYVMLVPTADKEQLATVRAKAITTNTKVDVTKNARNDLGFPVLKRLTPAMKNKNLPVFYEINGKRGILAQPGDTPAKLADRGNISFARFQTYNDLADNDRLVAGEVYYLKKKYRKAVVPSHTVQPEQTLWQVSQVYGVRLSRLLKFNRMEKVQRLQPGRVLWLQRKRPKNKPVEVINLPDPPAPRPQPSPPVAQRPTFPADANLSPTGGSSAPDPTPVPVSPNDREVTINVPNSPANPVPSSGRVVLIPVDGSEAQPTVSRPSTVPQKSTVYTPAPKPVKPAPMAKKGEDVEAEPEARPAVVKKPAPPRPAEVTTKPAARSVTHTVEQGETFFSIARKYEVSVAELREWNGLTENPAVKIGDQLVVSAGEARPTPTTAISPSKPAAVSKTEAWTEHTVQPGETFFSLTRKYGVTPQDLRDWNGFSDYPALNVGQVIKVKK